MSCKLDWRGLSPAASLTNNVGTSRPPQGTASNHQPQCESLAIFCLHCHRSQRHDLLLKHFSRGYRGACESRLSLPMQHGQVMPCYVAVMQPFADSSEVAPTIQSAHTVKPALWTITCTASYNHQPLGFDLVTPGLPGGHQRHISHVCHRQSEFWKLAASSRVAGTEV